MKKRYRLIFFAIGLAGIAFLAVKTWPSKADWQELFSPMLPVLFVALFALWGLIYYIHGEVYRIILGEDADKIKRYQIYKICVAGLAINNVTPAGLVGGEPYRIMELKRYMGTARATSVTLSFSFFYIFGHILLWLTGSAIYFGYGCRGSLFVTVFHALMTLVFAGMCVVVFSRKNRGVLMPILRFLSKVPFVKKWACGFIERRGERLCEIDSEFAELRSNTEKFRKAVLLEYAVRVLEGVEYFLIFRYLGENISIFGGILIYSTASLLGNLLTIIPMQAGTREGGTAAAVRWLGVEASSGMMGSLIYRVRDLVCTAVGILCIMIGRHHSES